MSDNLLMEEELGCIALNPPLPSEQVSTNEVGKDIKAKELSETEICATSCLNGLNNESTPNDTSVSGVSKSTSFHLCESGSNDEVEKNLTDSQSEKSDKEIDVTNSHTEHFMKDCLNIKADNGKESNGISETPHNDTDSETELCPLVHSDDELPYSLVAYEELRVPKNPSHLTPSKRSLKRPAEDDSSVAATRTKRKRTIQFNGVTVFYFPRSQGFTCVPSQGGSTLGMSRHHFLIKKFSLSEYAAEQRKSHRDYLLRVRQQKHSQKKDVGSQCSSSEDSEENSEEASDISDSELESDSFFFLQPLAIRQRRALLRQAGVRQIEGVEKEECKDIRISREMCGCQCRMYCSPDTCQCAEAGIKCQVDRHNFPCGCSRDGCQNPNGRIEFNPIRVRTHFLHTLMRLEIEKRQFSDANWDNSNGIDQQGVHLSWGSQTTNHASPENFAINGVLRRSLSFMNPNGASLSATNPVNDCANNTRTCAPHLFDHTIKDNSSFLTTREYNANNCNMFTDRFASPFESLTSLASFGESSSPFSTENSLPSCYHANSFPKFPSCSSTFNSSLSHSATMALGLQLPANPFSIEARRANAANSLLPVGSSCINFTNLFPQENANRFTMSEFSGQEYNKIDEESADKSAASSSLSNVLENLDNFASSSDCLASQSSSINSCFASCSDSFSHLPSSAFNNLGEKCPKPEYSYSNLDINSFSESKSYPIMAVKDASCETTKPSLNNINYSSCKTSTECTTNSHLYSSENKSYGSSNKTSCVSLVSSDDKETGATNANNLEGTPCSYYSNSESTEMTEKAAEEDINNKNENSTENKSCIKLHEESNAKDTPLDHLKPTSDENSNKSCCGSSTSECVPPKCSLISNNCEKSKGDLVPPYEDLGKDSRDVNIDTSNSYLTCDKKNVSASCETSDSCIAASSLMIADKCASQNHQSTTKCPDSLNLTATKTNPGTDSSFMETALA